MRMGTGGTPDHKKARRRTGGLDGSTGATRVGNGAGLASFGKGDAVELDWVWVVAFNFKEPGTATQHAIEFVGKHGDGFVAFVGRDRCVHLGPVNLNVPLGGEPMCDRLLQVVLQFHADAHDALLVAKQSVGFLANERLQGRRQLEVNARDDYFVWMVVIIHGFWVPIGVQTENNCSSALKMASASIEKMLSRFAAVVVTGGSSGIGKSFIEHIAKLHPQVAVCNLSRREPHINVQKLKLRHIPCDLAAPPALAAVTDAVLEFLQREAPTGPVLLINNSGFGGYGRFPEPSLAHQLEMIDVNVRAVIELTGRLLPTLKQRGGAILTIASTAAFQPTAYLATYGATKAFVLHWSLALNEELRGSGVRTLAVCPGPTATEFFRRAGLQRGAVPDTYGQSADAVVRAALHALATGRSQVVTGWKNKVLAAVSSTLPKPMAARVGAKVLERYRLKKAQA